MAKSKNDHQFVGTYQVDDGYAGGSRPRNFVIDEYEIEDDMTEDDLRNLFIECAQSDFEHNISFCCQNEDEFVEWAKDKIRRMEE